MRVGKDLAHDVLAGGLERAVVLGDVLARRIPERDNRRGLVVAGRVRLRVDGAARDEHVVLGRAAQQLRGGAHDTRHVPGGVDDRVPGASLKRREVAVPVAAQLLRLGKELRAGLAAVEEGDLVATAERGLDGRAAEELRPAENEELHDRNRTLRPCGF